VIVADTNLVVALLVPGPQAGAAERVFSADPDWCGPPLLFSELRNVVALYARRAALAAGQCEAVVSEARRLVACREEDGAADSRVLRLALGSGCTAYDCEFVALADRLGARLVTWDRQVLAAFPDLARSPEDFAGSDRGTE
jgi:predicted nucleic acid-binding protein